MSVFTTRPAARWLVPGVVAVAVVGGSALVRTAAAAADPVLPPRTAAQLLVDLQTAKLDAMSGTVVQHADLGLPAIPSTGGKGSSDLSSLITGDHTLRVWYSGPDRARVALLGTLGESDVIRNGTDLWTWDSQANTATHRTLADGAKASDARTPDLVPSTPQEAADAALKSIDPTTVVTTAGSARVAGRSAYEVVLAPRDRTSLIGQVRLAVDAQHKVPLRVQVYSRNATAASIEVAFTQVGFSRPDASRFRFAPPPGVTVTEQSSSRVPDAAAAQQVPGTPPAPSKPPATGAPPATDAQPASDRPVVIGTGWTSVLVAPMSQTDSAAQSDSAQSDSAPSDGAQSDSAQSGSAQRRDQLGQVGQLSSILERLPRVSGAWGSGRLLSGKLFSVLITDDGRVLAGAVAPDRLYQAAADPKAVALKAAK